MSITPFPSQGQYPWYDQLEQWGADTQAAAENATIAADQVHADVAGAVQAATDASAAAINAAGLVNAPAGDAVLAAISEGGAARNELNATIVGSVSVEATRRRRDIRAGLPSPMPPSRRFPLPSAGGLAGDGFQWNGAPINVYRYGNDYVSDFEPEGAYPLELGKTVYVDTVNGLSTNDGLTKTTAVQSIQKALTLVVDGDEIRLLDEQRIYRAGGFSGSKVTKSIRIRAENPGLIVACADNLTYTKTAGRAHVYQAARTNVLDVVDMGAFWAPDGYKMPQVADLATCDATPGSWWHDGTNVYVHTANGRPADSTRIFATLAADNLWVESGATDVHVATEGIRFVGGVDGLVVNAANAKVSFYARDCDFLHASGINTSRANGCNFMGAQYVYLRNCRVVGAVKDGFNYAAYNNAGVLKDSPQAIEIDCEGYDLGLSGAHGDTCNVSTGHSGAKIIRVNTRGHHCRGAIFAEVQPGTQSVNYGVVGFDSLSSTTGSSSVFHTQQAGADMWIYGGEGFGADWTIYASNGTWIGYSGISPETTQGSGTIVKLDA